MMRRWTWMALGLCQGVVCNVFLFYGTGTGTGRGKCVEPVTRLVRYTSADDMYITTCTPVSAMSRGT
jgi:hypothetical protein